MAVFVVDTDVVSFVFKEDTRAQHHSAHLENNSCIISFMTLAELDRWAIAHRWGDVRKSRMVHWLRRFGVEYPNRELCQIWAEVTEGARRNGRSIASSDAWIAAVAILMDVPLLTHNAADFRGVQGLVVVTER